MDLLSAFTSKALVFPGLPPHYSIVSSSCHPFPSKQRKNPEGNALCPSSTRVCTPRVLSPAARGPPLVDMQDFFFFFFPQAWAECYSWAEKHIKLLSLRLQCICQSRAKIRSNILAFLYCTRLFGTVLSEFVRSGLQHCFVIMWT